MDIVTLGAALNGSAEYVNSHFKGGSNIQIVDNPDGTQTISASGEVSSEDTVARAEIAAIKDGETLDSFGDVETALDDKADTLTTYTKTEVDTALSDKADKSTTYTKTEVDTALGGKVDKETGKGLSTNDYTTAEKTKLGALAEIKSVGTGLSLDSTTGELTATGGGGGGTDNYNSLSNKPQINGTVLSGNKTSDNLGLQNKISATNKIDSDFVDDENSANKFMSEAEKTKLASLVNYDDTEVKEDISDIETSLNSHKSDKANPHEVTKAQVGLGNVDNTSDANKPISTATQTALDNKANTEDINDINDTIGTLGVYEKKDFDDATVGTVSYYGQKIDVSKKVYIPLYYMSFKIASSNSIQGGAVYGDYYIQFTDKQSSFTVIDLKNRKVVQDTALTPVDTYHCNNVNFSDVFYSNDDVFPLLYVSMENIAEHKVLVYRLVGNVGEITLQLIQTITFDAPESCNVYYPNACIDNENGLLIQVGYTTNSYQKSDTNKIIFNVFNLPSLSSSNVSLPDNEKIDSFTLPSLHATQGSFVLDGKIYQVYGISGEKWIKVIDISTGKIVTSINLNNQNTIIGEQETLFVWNNELYTVGINKCIYKITTNTANYASTKKVLITPETLNGFSCAADTSKGALIYHRASDARTTIMIKKNEINPIFQLPVGDWTANASYPDVDGTSLYYMSAYGLIKIPEGATTVKLKMTNSNYYYGLVIVQRKKADSSEGGRIYDSGWKLGGTDIEYSLSGLDYTTYEYGIASTLKISSAGTASFTNETAQSLGWSYEFIF